MLLRWASELAEVERELKAMLTPDAVARVIDMIPEGWLGDVEQFPTVEAHREAYRRYFAERLAASASWVEEAARARSLLV